MSQSVEQSGIRDGYKIVEIGPKEFEIPEEWTIKSIPELCNLDTETFDPDEHDGETFEYVDIESVSPGTIETSKTIPVDEAPSRAKQIINEGDTLVGKVRPYLRAFAPVTEEYDGVVSSTGFAVLSAKDGVSSAYITQAILSKYFLDQMTNRMTGTSYPAVNKSDFQNVRLFVPSLHEQRHIADLLSKIDEQIHRTGKIIRETKSLKRGLAQDLFITGTNKVNRWKKVSLGPKNLEIPASWSVSTIGEVSEKVTDGTHNSPNTQESGRPYITSRNVREWGFDLDDLKYVSEEDFHQINSRCEPRQGDVLYVKDGANTGIAQVNTLDFDFCLLSSVALIRPSEQLSSEFLQQQLSWRLFKKVMESRMSGTGIKRLTIDKIKKSKILLPPVSEQEEISSILGKVDEMVKTEHETKQTLQELKRGLMQDLLTGEVRVNGEN